MAGGILLSISDAILTKKVLNFSATSVGFDMILPSMFKKEETSLFFPGLFMAKLISSQVFLEFD